MEKHFAEGLAEILEIDPTNVTSTLILTEHNWDSLAVVSTIAMVDEVFNVALNGQALARCVTVADIEDLIAKTRGG